ncbi:MAG: 4Fe-4S dicluster domain-containing protein [bacterium]|nr:4Fe-4S dicluster domain-containing protein [bacterium]
MSFIPNKKLHEGGIIREYGNAHDYSTGDWRTFVPEFIEDNCIQCMFCWIYCPDSAIDIDNSGPKPLMKGILLDHCKGCGICAHECPPAKKGNSALVMVREEK